MNGTTTHTPGTTGLVLCGGLGRRLGGTDKGLHPVGGKPLVCYVLDRLTPQVEVMMINANRNLDRYRRFGHPVIADRDGEFKGPLAGVLAGMYACHTEWLVTAPCDAPHLPRDLVANLFDAASAGGAEIACASDGERLQPTFCLYRTRLASALADYLESGERKIDRFLFGRLLVTVEFEGRQAEFVNLNAPDDISVFEGGLDVTGER